MERRLWLYVGERVTTEDSKEVQKSICEECVGVDDKINQMVKGIQKTKYKKL